MFLLKSCTRCRGDLNIDMDGEVSCIQCGYEPRPNELAALAQRLRADRDRAPARSAA